MNMQFANGCTFCDELCRGARTFGWQYAAADLPEELRGTSLFHSGWSGQTVLFDLSRRRYAVVLTTRCGDYSRASATDSRQSRH